MTIPQSHTLTEIGRERLVSAIEGDIEQELYDGAVIKVAHRGELVVDAAVGYADRSTGRPQQLDDVFILFSSTKSFTNVLVLRAIDVGLLSLTTPVVDIIPEFWGKDPFRRGSKGKVNVTHLLTHRSGLPITPFPVPLEEIHDLSAVVAGCCETDLINEPGEALDYSPAINHALLGEMVSRVDPSRRSYARLVQEEIFDPIGMSSSSIGPNSALQDRLVLVTATSTNDTWITDETLRAVSNAVWRENSQMPFAGGVSSAGDLLLFAETLRNWGRAATGADIVSPAILDKATRVHSGDLRNGQYGLLEGAREWEIPKANMGLGFPICGGGIQVNVFGTLNSDGAFGGHGAGSTIWWTDREKELSFVFLSTKPMEESSCYIRFQRLSDLVISALR